MKLSLICDGFTKHESFKLDAHFLFCSQTRHRTLKGAATDRTKQILEGFKSVNPRSKDSLFPFAFLVCLQGFPSISLWSPFWHSTKVGFVLVNSVAIYK